MAFKILLAASVLCVGIQAGQVVPRQSTPVVEASAVADPAPGPGGPGRPTEPVVTITAVVTSIATETNFVTVVNTLINNVTVEVTETATETDLETQFVTGFVTTSVTNLVTDVETEIITNIQTLPAVTQTELITDVKTLPALTKTEVVTNFKTLPAITSTQKVTLPAVTVHQTVTVAKPAVTLTKTATKTVVETATNPLATLCPGGSEEVFEAERGVFIIVCGQSRPTFDLIPGGQTTDSVYDCAVLCDSLTAAGVECSAGIFTADTSLCNPQGVDDSADLVSNPGVDTAVLNTTAVANSLNQAKLKKRSFRLF